MNGRAVQSTVSIIRQFGCITYLYIKGPLCGKPGKYGGDELRPHCCTASGRVVGLAPLAEAKCPFLELADASAGRL